MDEDNPNLDSALEQVDEAKRETLKRLIGTGAFMGPIVVSFAMADLSIDAFMHAASANLTTTKTTTRAPTTTTTGKPTTTTTRGPTTTTTRRPATTTTRGPTTTSRPGTSTTTLRPTTTRRPGHPAVS